MMVQRSRFRLRLAFAGAWISLCAAAALAQTRPANDELLPIRMDSFPIPPAIPKNQTPPRVVQLLGDALGANPHALRRVELVRDLGRCKLAAAVGAVLGAASDPESAVRAEAARSLALIGDGAAAAKGLRKLLADPDPGVRREAVRAGAALNDPAVVLAGLNDLDESVVVAACAVATTPEHAEQIATRLPSLARQAKRVAVRALGRLAAAAHSRLVADQLVSTDLPLTVAAIEALGSMKATSESEAVRKLLGHDHPTVRRAAVTATGAMTGADEQIAIARRLLNDADPSVRAAAARLLVAHPSLDQVSPLVAQLFVGHGPLRFAARDALVATASVAAQPTVDAAVKLLDDPDPRRREDGSFILGQVRSDAALSRHVALLGDAEWGVVAQVAESLGRIGRDAATPQLMKLAGDGVAKIRETGSIDAMHAEAVGNALVACGQLRHQPVVELVKPLISEKTVYPPSVRAPAIWAAGAGSDAGDSDVANRCLSVYRDTSPFEVEEVRFEAVKAIGNMRYTGALDEMRQQAAANPSPNLRWMAHRVAQRLSDAGTTPPYVPPDAPLIADTSIRDISK